MKIRFILSMMIGIIWMLPYYSYAQSSDPFAELVSLEHVCGDSGGSVEFELTGDHENYTYHWSHGPETLLLQNLEAGIYTLIVTNIYGCEEEYEVEILDISQCEAILIVEDAVEPCIKKITLQVFSNGTLIPEESLEIVWNDDPQETVPVRYINTNNIGGGLMLCAEVSVMGMEGICCKTEACTGLAPEPPCGNQIVCDDPIIVNEFNRKPQGDNQYIELLIQGDCQCEGTFDLRGYSFDDNNGLLIPANDFVTPNSLAAAGIDVGYLTFSQITEWSAIPNGSLIVIYDEGGTHPNMPADDPTDSNQDGVYVLASNNGNYLTGKTGTWNDIEQVQTYDGFFTTPEWELVNISSKADGIQVRKPDGEYSHGVSLGESAFSADNNFPLWITDNSSTDCNCQFVLTDENDKEHFTCVKATDNTQSPGLANSTDNANRINSLRDCGNIGLVNNDSNTNQLNQSKTKQAIVEVKNTLKVYPNPFQNEVKLNYNSFIAGEVNISIHSIQGELITTKKWNTEKGNQVYSFETGANLTPGVFILKFSFPSGEESFQRIIRVETY